MSVTYLWIFIACCLFLVEMMTGGFALMAFAIGGLVAAIGAALNISIAWQIVIFIFYTSVVGKLVEKTREDHPSNQRLWFDRKICKSCGRYKS